MKDEEKETSRKMYIYIYIRSKIKERWTKVKTRIE